VTASPAFDVLAGRPPARLPVTAVVGGDHAASRAGIELRTAMSDADILADVLIAALDDYQSDLALVFSDVTVEAEALGAEVVWPAGSPPRIGREIGSNRLRAVNPEKAGRMPVLLDALERVVAARGKRVPVFGSLKGPFSLAALATGLESLLTDALEAPDRARDTLARAADCQSAYVRAIVERGGIPLIGDPFASGSVLGPDHFDRLARPGLARLVEEVHDLGSPAAIHVCGNTDPVLASLLRAGADLYHLEEADLTKAAASGAVLMGGLPTELLLETGDEGLEMSVRRGIKAMPDPDRYIFAPVCDVPTHADPERVRAIVTMARRFS
jgi:uroporphyrinogen decarboxylase